GALAYRSETSIDGLPVRVPAIDIHTVGAGGGSLARLDRGGALRVGPESAGADPGPACYGRGSAATVTDADLVLGRLVETEFLGGTMRLDRARAERAIAPLARRLGRSVEAAAAGIVRVANAAMERALRVVTVERGHDPRLFTLVAFGGAGALHRAGVRGVGALPGRLGARFPSRARTAVRARGPAPPGGGGDATRAGARRPRAAPGRAATARRPAGVARPAGGRVRGGGPPGGGPSARRP